MGGWTAGEDVCAAVFFVQISLLERDTQTDESVVRGGGGIGPLPAEEDEDEDDVETLVRGPMVVAPGRMCLGLFLCGRMLMVDDLAGSCPSETVWWSWNMVRVKETRYPNDRCITVSMAVPHSTLIFPTHATYVHDNG